MGSNTYQNIRLNPGEDVWSNPNNPATGNGIDDDGNGLVDDWKGWNYAYANNNTITTNGHGTVGSGIISAKTNNNTGISGLVGGNNAQGVTLFPVCVGVTGPSGADLDDAILYAVDQGVSVITMSLSVSQTAAIDAAILVAVTNGVVVV